MSSRRVPDPGSLIAGITFAGVGLIFLVGNVNLADRARWVWPIVLVGLGAGLLAAVLRRSATPAVDGPAAGATGALQPTGPSTLAPAGAGPRYEPPAERAVALRDEAEPAARETVLDEGAEVERGVLEPGLAKDTPVEDGAAGERGAEPGRADDTMVQEGGAEPGPAQHGAADSGGAEDPPGLPRRDEP